MYKEELEDLGPILDIKTFQRHDVNNPRQQRVMYYQVTINGQPGHNVIKMPWYNFLGGAPHVGDRLYFRKESIGCGRAPYRVVKENQKTR